MASRGSEIASVCRDLDLAVTVAEREKGPPMGALGSARGMCEWRRR